VGFSHSANALVLAFILTQQMLNEECITNLVVASIIAHIIQKSNLIIIILKLILNNLINRKCFNFSTVISTQISKLVEIIITVF
jgi:hypothetical protein